MCFSATASFTLAAALIPAGAVCGLAAARRDPRWTALAVYPLAFGIQQGAEGMLWLAIARDDLAMSALASRMFLFFSHFFWLAWAPFSVYCFERAAWRRRLLLLLTAAGTVFGATIFLPALFQLDWLSVSVIGGSIEYTTVLIYDGYVGRTALRGVYAAIVVLAFLLSSDLRIGLFGGLIALSLVLTLAVFPHAFISVWCFFAAVLSTYMIAVVAIDRTRQAVPS